MNNTIIIDSYEKTEEEHKNKIKEYKKKYRKENFEKIKEKQREYKKNIYRVNCEFCGKEMRKDHLSRHLNKKKSCKN